MIRGAAGHEQPPGAVHLRPAVAPDADDGNGPGTTVPVPSDATAEPDDHQLLRAHVDGDPEAFAQLFRRHRDRLWAVALRTLADREEAADALQDALLSAHRAAPRFRGDAAVTTWLHRIVVNACLDRIRRRQAHPTVPLPDGTRSAEPGRGGGVEPAAPMPDHDTALVVRAALAKLPAEQRIALVLVDVEGYPVAEVAAILGVAEGTVKSRCSRGRARLALLLGHLRPTRTGPSRTADTAATASGRTRSAPTRAGDRNGTGTPTGMVGDGTGTPPGVVGDGTVSPTGPVVGDAAGVPPVTRGNPSAGADVRSASAQQGRDALQEEP